MELMFAPLKKYADFSGRARRAEFWLFRLFQIIVPAALVGLILVLTGPEGKDTLLTQALAVLTLVVFFGTIIPDLAVTVRRLHDIDRSGWWMLINFVPFGFLVSFAFSLMDGTPTFNRFGRDPKGRGAASRYEGINFDFAEPAS